VRPDRLLGTTDARTCRRRYLRRKRRDDREFETIRERLAAADPAT
jgi:hypothetical protein